MWVWELMVVMLKVATATIMMAAAMLMMLVVIRILMSWMALVMLVAMAIFAIDIKREDPCEGNPTNKGPTLQLMI